MEKKKRRVRGGEEREEQDKEEVKEHLEGEAFFMQKRRWVCPS